jgi:hypothetical protein
MMESSTKVLLDDRILRWLAWFLVAVYFLLAGAGIFLQLLAGSVSDNAGVPVIAWILQLVVVGVWPVIGALIINRHPRHPVGWLLFATFPVVAVTMFARGYVTYATSPVSGPFPVPGVVYIWLTGISEPYVLVAFSWMNLLFPTGRLISPRWRVVAWVALATLPVHSALKILQPGSLGEYSALDNPYAAAQPIWGSLEPLYFASFTILLLCSLVSVFSLVLRLRRSRGDERQQVKLLVLPAAAFCVSQSYAYFPELEPTGGAVFLVFILVSLIVIAVAVAIFRYRLYDIDIIIRRTLVYGVLTTTLVLINFSSVVVFQNLFVIVTGQESPVAVVISTLVIVALFSPLRRRIQNDIDRRFYRKKYDTEKVIAAFTAGLRQEVDIEKLSEHLLVVVKETLQPETLSLWLKE